MVGKSTVYNEVENKHNNYQHSQTWNSRTNQFRKDVEVHDYVNLAGAKFDSCMQEWSQNQFAELSIYTCMTL